MGILPCQSSFFGGPYCSCCVLFLYAYTVILFIYSCYVCLFYCGHENGESMVKPQIKLFGGHGTSAKV